MQLRSTVAALIATLPVTLLASMGYARRWLAEDAFIDLRVVRHILAGYGPVFNISERVEAYTNPLWVLLLSVWGSLGGSLERGAVFIGLGLSVFGLFLAQAASWRLASRLHADRIGGRDNAAALPLGALVVAAVPAMWDFASSGLESGLSFAWLGGVFALLAWSRPMGFGASCVAAFVIGCGPLIRPDLALFSVGFGMALAVITRRAGDRECTTAQWVGLGFLSTMLPVAYQVFRMGYFGALASNTALAKEAGAAYWSQGWHYFVDFVGTYALWIPLIAVMAGAGVMLRASIRQSDRATAALVLAAMLSALAHGLFVVRVGGDFMHGRLLLPALFAFVMPVATVIVSFSAFRDWRGAVALVVAVWACVCAIGLRVPYQDQGVPGRWGIADERGFYTHHMKTPNPVSVADYLRHPYVAQVRRTLLAQDRALMLDVGSEELQYVTRLAPAVSSSVRVAVGLSNVGVLGYLSGADIHVVDRLGLSDPIAARLLLTERGRPGHEKMLPPAWIIARFADADTAPWGTEGVAEAAAALRCGDLARVLRAAEAPLTIRQFAINMRDAWRLHRLRIPADPAAARRALCRADTMTTG